MSTKNAFNQTLKPGRGSHLQHAPTAALQQRRLPHCYVLTGVSGSGKSTIGKLLARKLKCPFLDGDDYHPKSNIEKMKKGHPLSDADREPWLQILANLLEEHVCSQTMCVMACSCLKTRYRQVLSGEARGASHADDIAFILLQPSREELERRLADRSLQGGHFMPSSLLDSQLSALEIDSESEVYGALSPPEIVEAIIKARDQCKPSRPQPE